MKRIIISILVAIGLAGCSGRLVTSNLKPLEINNGTLQGIVVYSPAWFYEEYTYTTLTDKTGKLIGDAAHNDCLPAKFTKLAVHADMNHPRLIRYEHGVLEGYTFQATMNDEGVLKSVNTVSTPDQGNTIKNLASAAGSLAGIAALGAPKSEAPKGEGPSLCNDGAMLTNLVPYAL